MVEQLPQIGGRARHAEQIYWAIVNWLSESQARPGERIPGEVEFAERFSVSRPTMREAIRVLEYSGLVESRRGRNGGLFVGQGAIPQVIGALRTLFIIGDNSRSNLREAREVIEAGVTRLAAAKISEEQLAILARSIDQMATDQSVDSVRESNNEFHLTIGDACGNDMLKGMMIALHSLLVELVQHTPDEFETFELKLYGHRRIYAALEKRDPDAAGNAMVEHIRTMGLHSLERQAANERQPVEEASLVEIPAM